MVSIPGSIGKVEALFDYIVELQHELNLEETDPQSKHKKRKVDQSNDSSRSVDEGHVQFPVSIPRVDNSTLEQLLISLDEFNNQNLVIEWDYSKFSDTIIASMKVFSQGERNFILENECVVMGDKFKENATENFQDNIQLFVAIVFAAHNSLLSASNVRLCPSRDERSLNLQVDLNFDMEKARADNAVQLVSALSRIVLLKKIVLDGLPPTKKAKVGTTNGNRNNNNISSSSAAPITPPTSSKNTPTSSAVASPPILPNNAPSTSSSSTANAITPSYISFSTPAIPNDISLENFFRNLQPPVSNEYLERYISSKMVARLTPFQSQNVEWMVNREGHVATDAGRIIKIPQLTESLPLLYAGAHTNETTGRYINLFTDVTTTNRLEIERKIHRSFKGGILADEMGLGKTVSVLGLISKHIWDEHDSSHPNPEDYPKLVFSKGTLIITPGAIMSQWASEAKRHAPGLSVYEYKGTKDSISVENLAKYDIVLVYYETFKSEISHSKPPPERSRRQAAKYKFKLSPLVSILWFRCILDEAQMVESTTTKVSSMAKLIPRWYSWAVTGTPMKSDYNDLFGLYNFLQLETAVSTNSHIFEKFHSDLQHKGLFFEFTKATMRRNMKALLTSQISIPRQTRHVVRIPFSTIEQHYYEDLWRQCKHSLQLDWMDSIGWQVPMNATEASQERFHNIKLRMRLWLLALRQNCIHPSVIVNTSLRLGNQSTLMNSSKKTQSLTDVLDDMARGARDTYDNNQHAYYTMKLKHGGMYEVLQDWQNAIDTYLESIPRVEALVTFHAEEVQTAQNNNKRATATMTNSAAETEEEEERKNRLSIIVNNHHRWNLLLHQFYFYLAGVYHVSNLEDLEVMYYNKAADIRRLLLEKQTLKVEASLRELERAGLRIQPSIEYNVGSREFNEDLLKYKVYSDEAMEEDGITEELEYGEKKERDSDINMLQNLRQIGTILDRQYEKILFLRRKTLEILTKKLIDNSDGQEDATGDEYEDSLSEQEMCQVYISAYQALLQDRKFIIKGIVASLTELMDSVDNGEYVSDKAKEIEAVEKNYRKYLKAPGFQIECFKDLEFFLRTLKNTMRKHESEPEYSVLHINHEWLKTRTHVQSKLIDDLDLDVRRLSQLFNSRIAYYKYLQHISDTLLEWKQDHPRAELKRLTDGEEKLEEVIANNKSRDQYFKALAEEQKNLDSTGDKIRKDCLICQEPIEKGMITYCGHTSCIDCGLHWFKDSRRCHTCNSPVKPNEWYNVSYKEMEMHDKDADTTNESEAGPNNSNSGTNSSSGSNNNEGSPDQLKELIRKIETEIIVEGQGAKLDRIIRHIKHIKNTKNGKCVVFSQWSKVLDMLRTGLNANRIQCITLSGGANKSSVSKFQEDPNINVILLHARSQSSGLTLVSAQTVFIVEPVFNETLEKQAINRIHRIGQTKQTSVFWYIVQDTIEERIQSIHNRKRDRKSQAGAGEIDNKLALSKLSDGGGEFVDDDDLRRCFTSVESYALG